MPFQLFLLFWCLGIWFQLLRRAVLAVAPPEACVFNWKPAVVVERCPPKHRSVSHHAAADGARLGRMAAGTAAGFLSHAQVAGIDKAHELNTLFFQQRAGAFRNAKLSITHPFAWEPRPHMGGILLRRRRIAAMTSSTRQTQRVLAVIELV